MDQLHLIQVPTSDNKRRLEAFLFDHFSGLSKMYLRDVVRREACEVNGRLENVGYRLRANDLIEIRLDTTRETAMRGEDIAIEVVHEDADIVIVNKPAGMLVHPSHRDKSGTLLNALTFHLNAHQSGAVIRPGLVHRLDKQTSGLVAVAKSTRAHRILAGYFARKRVNKRYLALVDGILQGESGSIEAPIGRHDELKHWSVKDGGKHAYTRYWVRERRDDATLLELEPVTGRTNQLRIHCQSIGHPIVGDVARGGREFRRLCLHAYLLEFPHPATTNIVTFRTNVPDFVSGS